MSMTYTWEITSLKTQSQTNILGDTLENAVVQTYWKKTGTDADGNTGSFSGATPFTAANTPADFRQCPAVHGCMMLLLRPGAP